MPEPSLLGEYCGCDARVATQGAHARGLVVILPLPLLARGWGGRLGKVTTRARVRSPPNPNRRARTLWVWF